MDSYQQSEPGQFPLKDGDANGNALSSTTPLKDQPKPFKTSPSLRYEDFTPTIVTDGREVRLEVSSTTSSLDDIYSLGRSIKILSLFEVVYFLAVFCFGSYMRWSLLLLFWGPVVGFAAGAHFNLFAAKCYVVFYILKIMFSVIAITDNLWWGIVSMVVNACLLRYVWLFRTMLASLGEVELDHLRAEPDIQWNSTPKTFYFF
eukprot:384803_1